MDNLSKQITLIVIASTFFVAIAVGIIILILVYQKRQLQYLNEKSNMRMNFEKELFQTQLEIQEQTFKNISQEIHDNIGQVLSLVKLNINTMDSNQPAPLQEKIDNSRTLISKAIQDLRDLSKSLNTDYVIEQGLMRSIEYELEMIRKTGSYEIEFDTNGKAYRLEQQQELIIFRIVQEILHNIIKHAKATKINVMASFQPEIFMLAIADNGNGFDVSKIGSENYDGFGLGIRNMHNRAEMIHADFKLTSSLQEGTTVTLTLPITSNL